MLKKVVTAYKHTNRCGDKEVDYSLYDFSGISKQNYAEALEDLILECEGEEIAMDRLEDDTKIEGRYLWSKEHKWEYFN
jgi:hypothetical protein